jgi:hypothetical protein
LLMTITSAISIMPLDSLQFISSSNFHNRKKSTMLWTAVSAWLRQRFQL